MRSSYRSVKPYVTKDGSQIRELMHPSVHGNRNQSVAEATVPARGKTALHLHQVTEEIYHITRGAGMMTLGAQKFAVAVGDTTGDISKGSAAAGGVRNNKSVVGSDVVC